ncbi:GAF domain-containing sensor histidine kinase [Omnitrophica bacterium]|nr:GAF domain-containing sensor histidine kinase [Candidatus Omnitrophota bacterium]
MSAISSNLVEKVSFSENSRSLCPSVLHSINEPDILVELALDNILSMVGAHAGSLFMWDEYQKTFVLKASRGPYREKISNKQVRLREGILGHIGDQGAAVLVKNISSDSRFQSISRYHHYRSSSFLSIPLIARNKLMGIINITERENLVPFDETDLDRAEVFAKHVAIAMENTRMQRRLQTENEHLHQQVHELTHTVKNQEALVSVGKLATNLTHELNNPLDAIRRYVNLALDQSLEDSLTREYLLKAKKGIRRAIGVIRGLLHYSRELHHSAHRTNELHRIISDSIDTFQHHGIHTHISFEKNFSDESIYTVDRGLSLVFKNLLRNAADAMKGEGNIKISSRRSGATAVITVEDNGPGIAESNIERIFEPFYSSKAEGKGTGVGLTFCREIIEKSGGKITCESQVGKGTLFLIELPCTPRM